MRTLAPTMALALVACSATTQFTWDDRAHYGLSHWTGSDEGSLDCHAGARVVIVRIAATCSGGSLRVRLSTPGGEMAAEQLVTSGKHSGTLRWPATTGAWMCEISGDDFSGDYQVHLGAEP